MATEDTEEVKNEEADTEQSQADTEQKETGNETEDSVEEDDSSEDNNEEEAHVDGDSTDTEEVSGGEDTGSEESDARASDESSEATDDSESEDTEEPDPAEQEAIYENAASVEEVNQDDTNKNTDADEDGSTPEADPVQARPAPSMPIERPTESALTHIRSVDETSKVILATIQNTVTQVNENAVMHMNNQVQSGVLTFESLNQWNRVLGTQYPTGGHLLSATIRARSDMQMRSELAFKALCESMRVAMDELTARCRRLRQWVDSSHLESHEVDVTAYVSAIAPDGEVGSVNDLMAYYHDVYRFGELLLTRYKTNALEVLDRARGVYEALDQEYVRDIPEALERALEASGDPRHVMNNHDLAFKLPVIGELWKAVVDNGNVNEFSKWKQLPVASIAMVTTGEVVRNRTYLTSLNKQQINDLLTKLETLAVMIDIEEFNNTLVQKRNMLGALLSEYEQKIQMEPSQQTRALQGYYGRFNEYIMGMYDLAAWPVLNFFTALAIMGNGIMTYAEHSLDQPEDAELVEQRAAVESLLSLWEKGTVYIQQLIK